MKSLLKFNTFLIGLVFVTLNYLIAASSDAAKLEKQAKYQEQLEEQKKLHPELPAPPPVARPQMGPGALKPQPPKKPSSTGMSKPPALIAPPKFVAPSAKPSAEPTTGIPKAMFTRPTAEILRQERIKQLVGQGLTEEEATKKHAEEITSFKEAKEPEVQSPEKKVTHLQPFKSSKDDSSETDQGKGWHEEFSKLAPKHSTGAFTDEAKSATKVKDAMWAELKNKPAEFVREVANQFRGEYIKTKEESTKLKDEIAKTQKEVGLLKRKLLTTVNIKKRVELKAQIAERNKKITTNQTQIRTQLGEGAEKAVNFLQASRAELDALMRNGDPKNKQQILAARAAIKKLEKEAQTQVKDLTLSTNARAKELASLQQSQKNLQKQIDLSKNIQVLAEKFYKRALVQTDPTDKVRTGKDLNAAKERVRELESSMEKNRTLYEETFQKQISDGESLKNLQKTIQPKVP